MILEELIILKETMTEGTEVKLYKRTQLYLNMNSRNLEVGFLVAQLKQESLNYMMMEDYHISKVKFIKDK